MLVTALSINTPCRPSATTSSILGLPTWRALLACSPLHSSGGRHGQLCRAVEPAWAQPHHCIACQLHLQTEDQTLTCCLPQTQHNSAPCACSCNVDASNHTELAGKFKPYVIKTLPLRCAAIRMAQHLRFW